MCHAATTQSTPVVHMDMALDYVLSGDETQSVLGTVHFSFWA